MAIEIIVPRLGWSMDEGIFSQWLVQDGDMVHEGDALFELESDKATQEVESFDSGYLRIPADAPNPGDTVKVGQCLGFLCSSDETAPALCTSSAGSPTDTPSANLSDKEELDSASTNKVQGDSPPEIGSDTTPATPSARRLARRLDVDLQQLDDSGKKERITEQEVRTAARKRGAANLQGDTNSRENGTGQPASARPAVSPRAAATAVQHGISLADITGSGRGGRIRERDVLAAIQQPSRTASPQAQQMPPMAQPPDLRNPDPAESPSTATAKRVPSTTIRNTISERMLEATQQTAQVTLMVKTDASQVLSLRNQCKAASECGNLQTPSMTGIFVKLVASALQQHPVIQQQWADGSLLVPDSIHVAVAVDTKRGLMAPVLRDVPALSLGDVTKFLAAAADRARSGQLAQEELMGGTFTVSNLGAYAVDGFTPILNMPQSAILGIGRIRPEPIVQESEIVIRDQVSLSLTFDHRVYDGAIAAAFLQTLCDRLLEPGPWMLQ